jgi:hypothetical protein
MMKGTPGERQPSMWVRNVQLAGFSCMIGLIQKLARLPFENEFKVACTPRRLGRLGRVLTAAPRPAALPARVLVPCLGDGL